MQHCSRIIARSSLAQLRVPTRLLLRLLRSLSASLRSEVRVCRASPCKPSRVACEHERERAFSLNLCDSGELSARGREDASSHAQRVPSAAFFERTYLYTTKWLFENVHCDDRSYERAAPDRHMHLLEAPVAGRLFSSLSLQRRSPRLSGRTRLRTHQRSTRKSLRS